MKSLGDPSLLRQIGGGRSPPLKTADRILAFISEWLRPLLVGLSLFLGISGGSWATMHWLWRSIELRIETLATLNRQIEEARWTLAEIEDTTWGVTLREIDGERFVVLPAGSLAHPPWTVRGRHAEQVEALQRQVERLDEQVTRLAADYGTIAATLRGRWR